VDHHASSAVAEAAAQEVGGGRHSVAAPGKRREDIEGCEKKESILGTLSVFLWGF
jgi:hypothetical protein